MVSQVWPEFARLWQPAYSLYFGTTAIWVGPGKPSQQRKDDWPAHFTARFPGALSHACQKHLNMLISEAEIAGIKVHVHYDPETKYWHDLTWVSASDGQKKLSDFFGMPVGTSVGKDPFTLKTLPPEDPPPAKRRWWQRAKA